MEPSFSSPVASVQPLCPQCRQLVDINILRCPEGHTYEFQDGVLRLVEPELSDKIEALENALATFRGATGISPADPAGYDALPDGVDHLEWRLRRYDLATIMAEIRHRAALKVLDVGAWNGWLSNRLAHLGHDAIAIDYFAGRRHGLGARSYFGGQWAAIQMDLLDLSLLNQQFDLIILNRCLAFFGFPAEVAARARNYLQPGGLLMATGLQIFADPRRHAARAADQRSAFKDRFNRDLYLRPSRGYLDLDDKKAFESLGLELRSYPQLWRADLKARFIRHAPRHYYAVWRVPAS